MAGYKGKQGRKPKPATIIERNRDTSGNQIAASKTTMPKFLNRHAKAEWKRITPELEAAGLLTKIDRSSLAAYCQAYGRWVDTENKIQAIISKAEEQGKDSTNAYLLTTAQGNIIISPLLSVANRCLEQMHTFLCEFGMTPASRSRISAAAKADPVKHQVNQTRTVPVAEDPREFLKEFSK